MQEQRRLAPTDGDSKSVAQCGRPTWDDRGELVAASLTRDFKPLASHGASSLGDPSSSVAKSTTWTSHLLQAASESTCGQLLVHR